MKCSVLLACLAAPLFLAACNTSTPKPTPPAPPASIDEPLDCDKDRRDQNGRPIPNC